MFQFFNPIYFIALAGLAIPVAIHIWNRKEGKRIKVGSIRWLKNSESSRLSSIKFSQFWLFFLRSLMVLFTVLLLTNPVLLMNKGSNSKVNGMVLMEPNLTRLPFIQQQVDSLQQAGYLISYIGEEKTPNPVNYWAALKELEQGENKPDKLVIFTSRKLKNFSGKRPKISIDTQWITIPDDTLNKYLLSARELSPDSLKVISGESLANNTRYYTEMIAFPPKNPEAYQFIQRDRGWGIKLKDNGQDTLEIEEPHPLRAAFLIAPHLELEAKYLQAALQAVARFTHTDLQTDHYQEDSTISESINYDVVVRFTDQYAPENLANSTTKTIYYQPHDGIFPGPIITAAPYSGNIFYLNKRLSGKILQDAQELPAALLELFFKEKITNENALKYDQRIIAQAQFAPPFNEDQIIAEKPGQAATDLQFYIWLLILVLFLAERMI